MSINRTEVAKQILRAGASGAMFQTREIREGLNVGSQDSRAVAAVHNHFKALHSEGLLEQVSNDRTRNRYFRISDEPKLRLVANRGIQAAPEPAKPSGGPERLLRVEAAIENLNERMDQLEAKIDEFIRSWS
jgi:hypothetical protein